MCTILTHFCSYFTYKIISWELNTIIISVHCVDLITFHNEELHRLYHSLNIVMLIKSRRLRWAGHVARMVEARSAFKTLTGTPAGKRPLGRPRRRWQDNIRMDLNEMGI